MCSEKNVAVIAAVLVALSFVAGSGFLGASTGAATSNTRDFYVSSVSFPAKMQANVQFNGVITFTNTGSLPATGVIYDFRVWDSRGVEYYRLADGTSTTLFSGENKVKLPTLDLPKAGTYRIKAEIDFYNRFGETDEENNIYETTISVV